MFVSGTRWCGRLPGHPDTAPFTGPLTCIGIGTSDPWNCDGTAIQISHVEEGEQDFGNPEGCVCASPAIDAYLSADPVIGDNENPDDDCMLWWFRKDVFSVAAVADCLQTNGDFNNCEFIMPAIDPADTPPMYPLTDPGLSACNAFDVMSTGCSAMGSLPTDSYSDHYALRTAVSWDAGASRYNVNAEFFGDILKNPGWIVKDGPRLEWTGGGWALVNVRPGTIAEALGLRTGDVPKKLNGADITDVDAALGAIGVLRSQTSFQLQVKRNGAIVTFNYELR